MSGEPPGQALPPIVINADDLGRDPGLNLAVLEAFDTGLVTSASIMANMPAFVQACELVRSAGLADRVGVHLNLTEGHALSAAMRDAPRFCRPDGRLIPRGRTVWRLSSEEARAIDSELAAQLQAVQDQGIDPTHLDSHHHVHTQWPIGAIVVSLARRSGIRAVRLARNCGPGISPWRWAYKHAFNARLARAGVAATQVFGSASDILSLGIPSGPAEVMVHPERDPGGRLVDCDAGASRFDSVPLLASVAEHLKGIGEAVSYAELVSREASLGRDRSESGKPDVGPGETHSGPLA